MKQLDPARSQLVQKPFAFNFQIPTFALPDGPRACRVILPSGVKVIVNLVPLGEAAVKGCALMSLGVIGCPAEAALASRTEIAIASDATRIGPPSRSMRNLVHQYIPLVRERPYRPSFKDYGVSASGAQGIFPLDPQLTSINRHFNNRPADPRKKF